eukprot:4683642-Pyramimonas_sp.AAC.1
MGISRLRRKALETRQRMCHLFFRADPSASLPCVFLHRSKVPRTPSAELAILPSWGWTWPRPAR